MTPLQKKLLELFCVFDKFCREQKLTYFMLGGTMLGAYRHKGFIPWDDDIDIGMPRADYERFIKIAEKGLPKQYIVRHRSVEKDVPYAFAHMEERNTTCIENRRNKKNYAGGVYLELFPLDGCSKSKTMQKVQAACVWFYKKLLYAKIMDYEEKHRAVHKALIIHTVRKLYSMNALTKKIDDCIQYYNKKENPYYSNHLGHWTIRENIKKKVFLPPKEYEFEGYKFYGAGNAHKYLTSLYGDTYMQIPSLEEQEKGKHPAYYLNLEMPYEEYARRRDKKRK